MNHIYCNICFNEDDKNYLCTMHCSNKTCAKQHPICEICLPRAYLIGCEEYGFNSFNLNSSFYKCPFCRQPKNTNCQLFKRFFTRSTRRRHRRIRTQIYHTKCKQTILKTKKAKQEQKRISLYLRKRKETP